LHRLQLKRQVNLQLKPKEVPMITADHVSAAPPDSSLRERKKRETRRRLRRVALGLFAERGYSNVTAEEIAEAAEVSTRTFFNYFPSKEAVLLSADPDRLQAVRESVMAAPAGTPAVEVLHAAMTAWAQEVVAQLTELGGDPDSWLRRMKAARADLHLRTAQAAQMEAIERTIAGALAERLDVDPERDPYPTLLAVLASGMFRASLASWSASGGSVPLEQLVDLAFQAVADGLPETASLRHALTGVTDRKDNY
jgi:AcrR family transcriptional regulator